ncbi:MAG: hypothetical protein AB7E60_07955, partial [Sphingobium sp.]
VASFSNLSEKQLVATKTPYFMLVVTMAKRPSAVLAAFSRRALNSIKFGGTNEDLSAGQKMGRASAGDMRACLARGG